MDPRWSVLTHDALSCFGALDSDAPTLGHDRRERDPDNLLAIDATEFARQLCLLHQETVARIQSLDLLTRTVPMTEMAMSGAHDHPGADSDADAIAHAIKLGNQVGEARCAQASITTQSH